MNVQWRNALIGFGLVVGISALMGFLGASGISVFAVSGGVGAMVWLLLAMLSGNQKMQLASPADRQAALAAPAPAGMGLVYIYRQGFYGRSLGFNVAIDALPLGQLKSPMFVRQAVSAGTHMLNTDVTGFAKSQVKGSVIRFEIQAGETQVYLLTQQVGMLQGHIQITQEVDPAAVLARLAKVPMIVPGPTAVAGAPPPALPPPPASCRGRRGVTGCATGVDAILEAGQGQNRWRRWIRKRQQARPRAGMFWANRSRFVGVTR